MNLKGTETIIILQGRLQEDVSASIQRYVLRDIQKQ